MGAKKGEEKNVSQPNRYTHILLLYKLAIDVG